MPVCMHCRRATLVLGYLRRKKEVKELKIELQFNLATSLYSEFSVLPAGASRGVPRAG